MDMIYHVNKEQSSLVAQTMKNLPTMQETQVQSLSQEDALEDGNSLPYPCLEDSMDRGAWQATVQGIKTT